MVKSDTTTPFVKTEIHIGKKGRRLGGFIFPHLPLKEALKLVETIRDENGGAPFSRITLAKSLDLSPAGVSKGVNE